MGFRLHAWTYGMHTSFYAETYMLWNATPKWHRLDINRALPGRVGSHGQLLVVIQLKWYCGVCFKCYNSAHVLYCGCLLQVFATLIHTSLGSTSVKVCSWQMAAWRWCVSADHCWYHPQVIVSGCVCCSGILHDGVRPAKTGCQDVWRALMTNQYGDSQ